MRCYSLIFSLSLYLPLSACGKLEANYHSIHSCPLAYFFLVPFYPTPPSLSPDNTSIKGGLRLSQYNFTDS